MSFATFADGAANLAGKMLQGIQLLPCEYTIDGKSETYDGDLDRFDAHAYYEKLRGGQVARTSLLNIDTFLTSFTPILKKGMDVIYISMSSGISGTYNAAVAAAQELMERFSERFVYIVDSLGCGFGCGMLAMRSAALSGAGLDARAAAQALDREVQHTCQYFTVDDIGYLKRTGRVSGLAAKVATVLNIKPVLFGNAQGQIVASGKAHGRRKAIEALAQKYREKHMREESPAVYISHGDCPEDAQRLAEQVSAVTPDAKISICQHEPFSGAHVGPGMLGLFFQGTER